MAKLPRRGDPLDVRMGHRLRARRTALGWSQEKLGRAVGVTFQMIQKYERGECRVSASRLQKIARALDVAVSWFFQDGQDDLTGHAPATAPKTMVAETSKSLDDSLLNRKETIDLLKLYYALPESLRKEVVDVVKSLKDAQAMAEGRKTSRS